MNSKDGELRLQESRMQSGEAAGTLQDRQRDGVVQPSSPEAQLLGYLLESSR